VGANSTALLVAGDTVTFVEAEGWEKMTAPDPAGA
jgi:hypothetical protein